MTIRVPKPLLSAAVLIVVFAIGMALGAALADNGGDDGNGGGGSPAAASTTTEPDEAASPPPPEEETDCDALGIDFDQQREGECEEDGDTFRVVNRDSVLHLPELDVRLVDIELTDTISGGFTNDTANGTFAIFTLEVTNKLSTPTEFDEYQEQVALAAMGNTYTQDFDAANGPLESSFLWIQEEIQPDATVTGDVVFDLPDKAARRVEKEGNLTILNFSDVEAGSPAKPIGIIRTYPPRAG